MKTCLVCYKKLDLISRIFKFISCSNCREKFSMGWNIDQIRHNGLHSQYFEEDLR